MPPWIARSSRVVAGVALGLALIFPWSSSVRGSDPDLIRWRTDLARAKTEAGVQGRLVWVQFTGPWCANCRRMERETFPDPAIQRAAAEHFIPVTLRADVNEELALGYGFSGLPASVVLRPSGEVVAAVQGFADPESFRAFLLGALRQAGIKDGLTVRRGADPARPARASAEEPLGLSGFCPVSLVENHRLVAGKPSLTARHDGQIYRFARAAARARFEANPERYAPVNGGRCPVAQVDLGDSKAGSPRWGILYRGHLYLCGDEANRQRFLQDPERYARVDLADRGFCPHCWALDGLLVRGRDDLSLTRDGRRFLFPGPEHRAAFRLSPETTRR